MFKKLSILTVLIFSLLGSSMKAQYGCFTPSLGVYDASTGSPMSAVMSCSYTNLVLITPVTVFSGSQAVLPCLSIVIGTTNVNSQTNNSLTIFQSTTAFTSLCNTFPAPCFTFIPNSTSYSFALAGLAPALPHSYSLCNVATAAPMSYTVKSCYGPTNFTTGVWSNASPNNCQSVIIPGGTPIGITSWTISPSVVPAAIASSTNNLQSGNLFLDTYFMTPGIYTITMGFDSQVGCTSVTSRTIQIQPAYNANWTAIANQCSQANCVSLNPQITGNTGGTFSGAGVTSNSFCPSSIGAGTYPVTYTVGITPQCRATFSNNITVIPNPTLATTNVSFTCLNPTTVQLVATGAAGGSYVWSGLSILSQSTGSATVFGTGNYTINATGSNGCQANPVIASVGTNTTPPSISGGSSSQLITCSTLSTTVSISNTVGLNYSWSGPGIVGASNISAITATAGGNYIVTVTNPSNGCSANSTVLATQNKTVTNTPSTGGVITCLNSAITLSTTATTPIYNITWTGPGGSSISSPNASSTGATSTSGGNFTVSVLNTINGCTSTSVIAASINTSVITPTAMAAPSGVLNCTNTNVGLTGNPASGVSYAWSGPGAFSSSVQSPTVSAPGVYSLVVTNSSNGCASSASSGTVNVTQNITNPTVTASSAITPTLGCGASSVVAVSVNVLPGGSAINWSSSGGGFVGPTNTATANVTTPTTYTAVVTHPTSGCLASLVFTINPSSGASPVNASATSGTVTCTNTTVTSALTTTGTVTSYNWSGPGGGIVGPSNTATVTAQLAGTYTYNILFSNGCTANGNFIVSANNATINPNAVASNSVNCNNTNATITVVPSPTSSAYTYSWSTGSTATNIIVSPSSTTAYTVAVTNTVNGCKGTQTVTINASTVAPTAVGLSPGAFTLACSPPNTILTASATGAASYSWASSTGSISATTSTLSVNAGGTYSVFAIGANGCSSAAQVSTITPPAGAPVISLSNANPSITCLSSSPSVSVTVTSTVPIQSYTWGPSSGISGATNTNVVVFNAPGTYTGVITANNGCPTNTIIVVSTATTAPSFVAGTGTAQALSCTNTLVTIAPTFTPSNANLTYTWTGLGIVGSANNSSVQVNQNGTYSLTVTNTLTGCSSNSLTVNVFGTSAIPSLSLASSSSVGISCAPGTSTITLTASSNASSPTYSWSTGATTSSISTSAAGIYSVTVTNTVNGCSSTQTINVSNNTSAPSLSAAAQGQLPCGGGSTTLNALSSNTNVTYSWLGSGIVSGSNTANAEINAAGVYTVVVTDAITNCSSTQTIAVSSNSVAASFTANTITGPAPLNVNFNNTSIGATTYTWSFGNNQTGSNDVNPSNTFPQGTFTVVLVAQNGACTSTATIEIKVLQGLGEVPEVFTPNGDGFNPFFEIKGLESYPKATLQVFNRWGNVVFSASPYDNKWDGTPNQSSLGKDKLPSGTYYYILDLKVEDIKPIKGYVQLQY
jgi:gliding motility-associated-like protein